MTLPLNELLEVPVLHEWSGDGGWAEVAESQERKQPRRIFDFELDLHWPHILILLRAVIQRPPKTPELGAQDHRRCIFRVQAHTCP